MLGYKYYIYFSDDRKLVESQDFRGLFKEYLRVIRSESDDSEYYISFGVSKGMESCDLYYRDKEEKRLIKSNDILKSDSFRNDNIIRINVINILMDIIFTDY